VSGAGDVQVRRAAYADVQAMRDLHRQEMDCQIRYDSHLGRGLADAYLLLFDGRMAGYGGVPHRYDAGRLTEFSACCRMRGSTASACSASCWRRAGRRRRSVRHDGRGCQASGHQIP